jgi:hypothetical protein
LLDVDVQHVKRLESMPELRFEGYPNEGHNIIRRLRANGTLTRLLSNALSGNEAIAADAPAV